MAERVQRGQGAESDNGFLTATPLMQPNGEPTRPRSTSISPSVRSSRSHHTYIEGNVSSSELRGSFQRQQTYKIGAKLSLWDRVKGLFNPEFLSNKIIDSIETVSVGTSDEKMFDHSDSPFIKTIAVSHKDNGMQFLSARCMLDTGCLQGNLVSKDFVHRLGFKESDFRSLTSLEKEGGKSVTGDIMIPDGVVNLSWHHGSSPRYRDMRFLVAPHAEFDVIIGGRTITKYGIITPPNLSQGTDQGIVRITSDTDQMDEEHKLELAKLNGPRQELQVDIGNEKKKSNPDKDELKRLENDLAKADYKYNLKALELEKVRHERSEKHLEVKRVEDEIKLLKEKHVKRFPKKKKNGESSKKSKTPGTGN